MGLKAIPKMNLVEMVEERILQTIRENNLSVGDSLPSELELTEGLGVSRTVVREALSRLRMLGLLESRKKRGMVIKEPDVFGGCRQILDAAFLNAQTQRDLFEMRLILEIGLADALFMHKTDADLEALEGIVKVGRAGQGRVFNTEADATPGRIGDDRRQGIHISLGAPIHIEVEIHQVGANIPGEIQAAFQQSLTLWVEGVRLPGRMHRVADVVVCADLADSIALLPVHVGFVPTVGGAIITGLLVGEPFKGAEAVCHRKLQGLHDSGRREGGLVANHYFVAHLQSYLCSGLDDKVVTLLHGTLDVLR